MNIIHRIVPRKENGVWIFDDEKRGLQGEAFVSGSGEILDAISSHIPEAHKGITILFSEQPFPTARHVAEWERFEGNGSWYHVNTPSGGLFGWLCPAMLLYFDKPPEKIYIQVI